jgi:hypothetical protein
VPSFVPVQIDGEETSRGAASELDRAPPVQTRLLEQALPAKLGGVIEIEVSEARVTAARVALRQRITENVMIISTSASRASAFGHAGA